MILALAAKRKKTFACTMLALMYFEMIIPPLSSRASVVSTTYRNENSYSKAGAVVRPGTVEEPAASDNRADVKTAVKEPRHFAPGKRDGGPTQPEMAEFHSVSDENMVDLFTGDFSYSIPLMDVGGYPIAIGYNSGITMDQEASWVGLGWNLNPGTISRNMRGIPDEFNGTDSLTKTQNIKPGKTIGATAGLNLEIVGLDQDFLKVGLSASMGVYHNTYRGWGLEMGTSAGIRTAKVGGLGGSMNLGFNNSTQNGLTISPSLSGRLSDKDMNEKGGFSGSLSLGAAFNSREGMKAVQFSAGLQSSKKRERAERSYGSGGGQASASISFTYPSYSPSMSMSYTNSMVAISLKGGWEASVVHPSLSLSGYVTRQEIDSVDRVLKLPAYGYLNYQNANGNPLTILDYNREKDITYREKPELPNIAVPNYTYDIFTISGEGVGGNFRGYRSDIGFIYDHKLKTKDKSGSIGVDLGFGNIGHVGADATYTRSFTENGPWIVGNPLASTVAFTKGGGLVEPAYFRNPGEKTVNTKKYYDAIGGEDVIVPKLLQSGPDIRSTNSFIRYRDGQLKEDIPVTPASVIKTERDKRTQVITYMTAKEASLVGQSPYIENHLLNKFKLQDDCAVKSIGGGENDQEAQGMKAEYFKGMDLKNEKLVERVDTALWFDDFNSFKLNSAQLHKQSFCARWTGRFKAPVTGIYDIMADADDGVIVFINDSAFIAKWNTIGTHHAAVNLEAGQMYNLRVEYVNKVADAAMRLRMVCGSDTIKPQHLFTPTVVHETLEAIPDTLIYEKRITGMRKANHISQIEVLSPDGRRNIYGLPVYNIKQKEASFAVKKENGNAEEGVVSYNHGVDNTLNNKNGNDWYFSSEETPAYPHSFLLTGIVSPDYQDLTGNGISDDDPGNAVKFNYTKTAGIGNPFKWRTPYSAGANYNEGFKSDSRDDKGSYVYGEKELWYLNSIESKNMVATFVLGDREDQRPITEDGQKIAGSAQSKRLEEINLYTKADFMKYNTAARPIKTVHFEYSYELCKGYNKAGVDSTSGKLTLKRIWFTYNGNKKGRKNAYVFNYTGKNPNYNHKSFDRWGNYKDPADNPGYTSSNRITNNDYPYAIQDSAKAAANMAAWTLDSIVLPSGGRMKITYESDDYAFVQHTRAARMYNIAGFSLSKPQSMGQLTAKLYGGSSDYSYVAVNVPEAVSSDKEVYTKYLSGLDGMMAFRLSVKMPSDKWGSGYEYVPAYASLASGEYGFLNGGKTIWFRVNRVNDNGEPGGDLTPMAKAAAQFLRLNLPSKAYPGSDVGDELDLIDGVRMLTAMADNVINTLRSFDATVRSKGWARDLDLSRSWVRLNVPDYKKYGNGLRVKRVVIYDNWNKMTGRKESMYGTEYEYTKLMDIDGVQRRISSGVATYEPVLGGEENPLRVPIEYSQRSSLWAPVTMGYVETPIGESFYPGPSVGYSSVITRSIHNAPKVKSRTGYKEHLFYTAYDFPTFSDYSIFNPETKKTHKPKLKNFLKINAKHYLTMSQGFKVELNDMHGKPKAEHIYAETDIVGSPSSYTRYYYHVENDTNVVKKLSNTVLTIDAAGKISSDLTIGEDVEVMMDMRQSRMVTNSVTNQVNVDVVSFGIPPVLGIPTTMLIPQSEEDLFRSAAAMKVVNRHGILDRTEAMDKGSKVVTKNLLYDGETGDVILTATQNEFGDSIYNFNYPAGWMYEGMAGAYKNVNATLEHVYIKGGKIISGASTQTVNDLFFSGDEILTFGKNKVNDDDCNPVVATFSNSVRIWAVDANELNGGEKNIYFLDENGAPYAGNDVSLKVFRSGRRNIAASAGTITMMRSPLDLVNGKYTLNINKDKKIINASVTEYQQNWQVQDRKKQRITCAY